MSPLKIAIIGAGIGGPAAAIGLARNGHDVTIYERAKSTSEVGFAFRITENSEKCLTYLGIDVQASGACPSTSVRMMTPDGITRGFMQENTDDKSNKGVSVFAFRPQVNEDLMRMVHKHGVKLQSGVKVINVDIEHSTIELEDGSKISADVIIASDGVHSKVRSKIIDSTKYYPTASTGHAAFRFMLPRSILQDDEMLSELIDEQARMFIWSGNDKQILAYPVDFDKQLAVTCVHPDHLTNDYIKENDSSDAVVSQERVLEIYKEYEPRAIHLLKLGDPNGFRVWKLLDMDDIPTWTKKNTVLLGDACHPVNPSGFSGASMAIEDAVTLSVFLTQDTKVEDIPDLLKLYETIRRPRIDRVRESAREIARGRRDPSFINGYKDFLSEHDAVHFARTVLEEHKKSQL